LADLRDERTFMGISEYQGGTGEYSRAL